MPSGSPSPVCVSYWEAITQERDLMPCWYTGMGFPLQDPPVVLLQTFIPSLFALPRTGNQLLGQDGLGRPPSQALADFPFKASNHAWAT